MDEDATWYGGRPRRRPHCIRRVLSAPRKRHSTTPSFRPMSVVATVAHLRYCWALVQTVTQKIRLIIIYGPLQSLSICAKLYPATVRCLFFTDFKRLLKTYLFGDWDRAPRSFVTLVRRAACINYLTYLLTYLHSWQCLYSAIFPVYSPWLSTEITFNTRLVFNGVEKLISKLPFII